MLRPKKHVTFKSCFLPAVAIGVSLLPFGNLNAQKTKQLQSTPVLPAPKASTGGWRPVASGPSKTFNSSPLSSAPVRKSATVPSPQVPPLIDPLWQQPSPQLPQRKVNGKQKFAPVPFQKSVEVPLRPSAALPDLSGAQVPLFPKGKTFGNQTNVPLFGRRLSSRATTAEKLLQQLTTEPTHYYTRPELSAEELGKSVEQLRERFPFRSIRDRLYFVDGQPATKIDDKEPPSSDGSRYAFALRQLHSERVQKFITQEGFGVTRITPVGPQDLFSRDQHYALTTRSVDSSVLHEQEVELDKTVKMQKSRAKMTEGELIPDYQFVNSLSENGLPKQQLLSIFNSRITRSFANRTGLIKDTDQVAGFEAHRVRAWSGNLRGAPKVPERPGQKPVEETKETSWKINRIELVSLLMHDEPCVYDTDELPDMEELNSETAAVRPLSAFEAEGIKALKSGEEMLIRATKNRVVMVGAIRATGNCADCHSGQSDDLLGAFSYEFLRSPAVDTVAEQEN